ncbi:LexA family transcriptional regulator [Helcococcus bovis]|uniref:LexA family protein n=1 Tax=Helcococcus bovis TaxID=3153252 RepID=UPI0038B933BB
MNIGDRIKNKRKSLNLTLKELGKKTGVSDATIQRYESGNISNIPSDRVELIAKALSTTPGYLMGWEKDYNLDLEKIKGITLFNRARQIPIVGTIACGTPIFADENLEGYFIADSSIRADFALKCKGDSMIDAEIYDGDTVFLKKTPDVENGKIAAVLIDNEATLKKVIKTNDVIILQPCNSNSNLYKPILLDGKEDTMILGEMVGVYHPYKK